MRSCYEIAPPRVKRYLEAEIEFILDRLNPSSLVLELGCGYGRVLQRLAEKAKTVVGIDTSPASLISARKRIKKTAKYYLANMNAVELGFYDGRFDVVICIQNGISAFRVDQRKLIREVPGPGLAAKINMATDKLINESKLIKLSFSHK